MVPACYEILECVFREKQVVAMLNADHLPEDDTSGSSRTPLIPIGLAIITVLMVPVFLYSVGPEGPFKVGDVVFSTGLYRVQVVAPDAVQHQGAEDSCMLEPRSQLVVQKIGMNPIGSMIAEPIALEKAQAPFCPPRTPVLLHAHQATLKADLWGGLRDTALHFFPEN
jgi:hypothetical protein